MLAKRAASGAVLALTLGTSPLWAQFRSGSDGSYGPITVPAFSVVTLDLPPSGIINATTVTVDGVLKFRRNALNTPVYLLATGDIVVNNQASVDVSGADGDPTNGGLGGPGGFEGGAPGIQGAAPGAGLGPGAGRGGVAPYPAPGHPGNAAYATQAYTQAGASPNPGDGVTHGSPLLVPLLGGSGGGGGGGDAGVRGGGGGGGAILMSSDTQVIFNGGQVSANGGAGVTSQAGCGSGGGIRIVAPKVVGPGGLVTQGGPGGYAGAGRIRVDVIDRSGFSLSFAGGQASVGSFMTVFPSVVPRLDVVNVAGNAIPEGTTGPVVFVLPFNSPTTQPITVQARDFTGTVPIRIVLTPDFGEPTAIDAQIDMAAGNPASVTVAGTFPRNVAVRVNAWTR